MGLEGLKFIFRQREVFKSSANHHSVPRLQNLPIYDSRFEQHAQAILNPSQSRDTEKSVNGNTDGNRSQFGLGDEPFDYAPQYNDMSYQSQNLQNYDTTNSQSYQNMGSYPMYMTAQSSMQSKQDHFIL